MFHMSKATRAPSARLGTIFVGNSIAHRNFEWTLNSPYHMRKSYRAIKYGKTSHCPGPIKHLSNHDQNETVRSYRTLKCKNAE